jgi:nucleoside-diphosphate-sugar epimerase
VNNSPSRNPESIVGPDETILVTGAAGFIGTRVVQALLQSGYKRVRCLVRSAGSRNRLRGAVKAFPNASVEMVEGNLLSRRDCLAATAGVQVVYHLAAGLEKTYAGCYLNSVVSTRNLLDAVVELPDFRRFVNVSSLSVYSNFGLPRSALLDERCELERDCVSRHEPYAYAKLKQDELVIEYSARHGIPYVILRPAPVYGPGQPELPARVGINTFGFFLHLGARNRIPLTYVDNCATAIVLGGTVRGIDGEVINVIDDELPSSREFLARYQREVGRLPHISVPYRLFYLFCLLWEVYSRRSSGQLPPVFNRRRCSVYWKGNQFSNRKLKELLGWNPPVSLEDGLSSYFEYLRTVRASSC